MIKGFQSSKKTGDQEYATLQNLGSGRFGIEAIQRIYYPLGGAVVAATSNSTLKNEIISVAHGARVGDIIRFSTVNANEGLEIPVLEIVDADNIKLADDVSLLISTADEFYIMRPSTLSGDQDGNLVISQGPIQFSLDGAVQEVVEDTVTPSNNAPLPVKLTSATGDINITAGDLNVQLSHLGASFDSTRIGDGVTELGIKPVTKEALVIDSGAIAELVAIKGLDFATQTTLASVLAKQDDIISAINSSLDVHTRIINDSSLNPIPTGSYLELVAAISADVKKIKIFHGSGDPFEVSIGASGSESSKFYVTPGMDADIDVSIPAGTRISAQSLTGGAINAGTLIMNFMG